MAKLIYNIDGKKLVLEAARRDDYDYDQPIVERPHWIAATLDGEPIEIAKGIEMALEWQELHPIDLDRPTRFGEP